MKLRIRGNSIRLRLLKSEVAKLDNEGHVSESTVFGENSFVYSIRLDENAENVTAKFADGEMSVILSNAAARNWFKTEDVGISAHIENGAGGLEILIEKDFECKTRVDDPDRDDTYPHPDEKC